MPRSQKKQVVYCSEHEFRLVPVGGDTYYKQPMAVSFCKGRLEAKGKSRKRVAKDCCICAPCFNKDCNHATSTFILPEEQKNYMENCEKFKLEHDLKVQDYNDEKTEMLVPKPKTRYSFCNTCRTNYDDYLNHIRSEEHRAGVRKSLFSRYILELERKYEDSNKLKNGNRKTLPESVEATTQGISQSDADLEMLGLPTKKVKRSGNEFPEPNQFSFMPFSQFHHPFPHPRTTDPINAFSYQSAFQAPQNFLPSQPLPFFMNYNMYGNPWAYWGMPAFPPQLCFPPPPLNKP